MFGILLLANGALLWARSEIVRSTPQGIMVSKMPGCATLDLSMALPSLEYGHLCDVVGSGPPVCAWLQGYPGLHGRSDATARPVTALLSLPILSLRPTTPHRNAHRNSAGIKLAAFASPPACQCKPVVPGCILYARVLGVSLLRQHDEVTTSLPLSRAPAVSRLRC